MNFNYALPSFSLPRISPVAIGMALVFLFFMADASAQSASMPWVDPICRISSSFSGPVARGIAVIAIVICGLLMAFGELGGVFKTVLGLLMGVTMAVSAVQWMNTFAGSGGGVGCGGF